MSKTKLRLWAFAALTFATTNANSAEVCGNGLDDDANGLADEGCYPTLTTGQCESPLSCGDTGLIAPRTGSLHYALPPDVAPGVPYGPGISFARFYLSQYAPGGSAPAYRTALGPRWGHSYATWIDDVTFGGATRMMLHSARGQDVLFTKTGSDATWDYFAPQAGFHFASFKHRRVSPFDYEIKLLTGESFNYESGGRLKEIRDTLATPNVVHLDYDVNGQLSTVTDASGKRRLLFAYTSGFMSSVKFQILISAVWTDEHTTTYSYTSGNLIGVTMGSTQIQTNNYTSNYLTSIQDHEANTLISFVYDGTTPGKLVRVDTPRGVLGYEFASSRANCSGKTVLYFHKANTTSCNVDADCGTGNLCGGKTGTGSTGQCFRGARCLTISSPNEDVITGITAFAGNSETCDGACLDTIDHVWDSSKGNLDLTAVKDPSNFFTTKAFNSNGLPTRIVYGDTDSIIGGGVREAYLFYGDSNFPGLVTEVRRKSEITTGTCSDTDTTACARTMTTYTTAAGVPVGKPLVTTQTGTHYNGTFQAFSYVTTRTYDAYGRIDTIDGPLAGSDDLIDFDYWSSTDPFKDGFLQYFKRKVDSTNFLTQQSLTFDFWGNATSIADPDGTISCQTFDATRNYLTQQRETMAGQTDCTANAADLVTSYARDSALRLTQLTRPDGSCLFYEYDTRGRLLRVKRRDDCNAASAGDREELTYSDDGLLTKTEMLDASGAVTRRQELTYFDSQRLEKTINPVNTAKWTGIAYDARGLVDNVAAVDGASNLSKSQWTYNNEGRVATERRYTAGSAFDSWSLFFDWIGNHKQVTDGDSRSTYANRDDLGRIYGRASVDHSQILQKFDAANRMIERSNPGTNTFTYDNIGRVLTENWSGTCLTFDVPDIVNVYDSLTGAPSCPAGATCTNLSGRLAYTKVKLMCTTSTPGPDADYTLEQETWYGYDPAGRLISEYISDDNGRTAAHSFTWTKNGALQQTTLPSTAVLGATFGSAGSNSDTDLITALWRTNTGTPIIDNVLYEPFGPLKQYDQKNSPGTGFLRTRIAHNLAYRQTLNIVEKTDGTSPQSSVTITEDAKGRTISRDYYPSDPTIAGRYDSFYSYDLQDRVLCEATTSGTCPTSGATLKNNHNSSPPFKAAGDWKSVLRPIPGSTGVAHTFTLTTSTHRIASVAQPSGTPTLGTTTMTNEGSLLGRRTADDNTSTLTHDGRTYTYDSRSNLVNVRGEYFTGGAWHFYDVASAFDAKTRRVFKSFYDETTAKTATWFFYYDALDRLVEVRYTPDTSVATTYSIFQLVWLGDKLVLYWQTDLPSSTTTKRYISTDEMNRPVDMMSWPASGAAVRVWTINPDAWGNDVVLLGNSIFQPILFAGQYKDDETCAWQNDGVARHRPGLVLNGFRTYDPWTGSYLQVDPLADSTWSSYVYVNSDPVGKQDISGLVWSEGFDIRRQYAFGVLRPGTGGMGGNNDAQCHMGLGLLAGILDGGLIGGGLTVLTGGAGFVFVGALIALGETMAADPQGGAPGDPCGESTGTPWPHTDTPSGPKPPGA